MTRLQITRKELPSYKFKKKSTITATALIIFIFLSYLLDFNPILLITDFDYIIDMASEMVPPNLAIIVEKPRILGSLSETFSMLF